MFVFDITLSVFLWTMAFHYSLGILKDCFMSLCFLASIGICMFWLSNFLLCAYLIKIILKNRHDHNKLDVCIILFEQYRLAFPIKITKTTCYLKSTQRSYALEIYVLTNLGTGRKCYMLEPVNMITSLPYKLIVPNYQIKWLLNLIYDIVVT